MLHELNNITKTTVLLQMGNIQVIAMQLGHLSFMLCMLESS